LGCARAGYTRLRTRYVTRSRTYTGLRTHGSRCIYTFGFTTLRVYPTHAAHTPPVTRTFPFTLPRIYLFCYGYLRFTYARLRCYVGSRYRTARLLRYFVTHAAAALHARLVYVHATFVTVDFVGLTLRTHTLRLRFTVYTPFTLHTRFTHAHTRSLFVYVHDLRCYGLRTVTYAVGYAHVPRVCSTAVRFWFARLRYVALRCGRTFCTLLIVTLFWLVTFADLRYGPHRTTHVFCVYGYPFGCSSHALQLLVRSRLRLTLGLPRCHGCRVCVHVCGLHAHCGCTFTTGSRCRVTLDVYLACTHAHVHGWFIRCGSFIATPHTRLPHGSALRLRTHAHTHTVTFGWIATFCWF